MNLVASDEEVDAKLAEMKAPYTQEEFDRRLQAASMSLDDLRTQIRRNLTSEKLMNKEVNSRINITDADVTNFYNANKAQFNFIEPKYNHRRNRRDFATHPDAAGSQPAEQQSGQRRRGAQKD